MNFLAALCLVGLTVSVHGFSVQNQFHDVIEGFKTDEEVADVEHKGHCACNKHGCWCHAMDADVKVQAVFSVVETRQQSTQTLIAGTFFVGTKSIEKQFPVDQFEDFCEDFDKKRFCFRVDISDKGQKGGLMKGCLRMSRPKKVDMGCFNLPLLTSSESIDSDEEYNMDIPQQLADAIDSRRKCMCCPHGCACQGNDDGYNVVVVLSVNECNHHDKRHTIIEGLFRVGNVSFEKEFHDNELKSFCKFVERKSFCFSIRIYKGCGCHIRGHIALRSPKMVDLGYFNLPMVTSSTEDDDDASESDDVFSSDDHVDDDSLLFV